MIRVLRGLHGLRGLAVPLRARCEEGFRHRMLAALILAAGAVPACYHSTNPLSDPDLVTLFSMVVAGETTAYALVSYPHRTHTEDPPEVSVTISHASWAATFVETTLAGGCGGLYPDSEEEYFTRYVGAAGCLQVALPEPVRAGGTYLIAGTSPAGNFTGETTVPANVELFEPVGTLTMDADSELRVPARFSADSTVALVGVLAEDAFVRGADGREVSVSPGNVVRVRLRSANLSEGTGELAVYRIDYDLSRLDLRLAGLGPHYAAFIDGVNGSQVLQPWPAFGVDGIYGYFSGAVKSSAVRVEFR